MKTEQTTEAATPEQSLHVPTEKPGSKKSARKKSTPKSQEERKGQESAGTRQVRAKGQ